MITLRLTKHHTDRSNRESYLYLTPGTFYVIETVDRDSGGGHSTQVHIQGGDRYQVVETATEIEEKINAPKEL